MCRPNISAGAVPRVDVALSYDDDRLQKKLDQSPANRMTGVIYRSFLLRMGNRNYRRPPLFFLEDFFLVRRLPPETEPAIVDWVRVYDRPAKFDKNKYMSVGMADEKNDPACNHMIIGALIMGLAFFIFFDKRDGFRSLDEKRVVAGKLIALPQKPGYETARSLGLDGAEFYQVRQLWNDKKFTEKHISNVL